MDNMHCSMSCSQSDKPRSDAHVTHANDHRRRFSSRLATWLAIMAVALSASIPMEPAFARDALKWEDLKAWWNETQVGRSSTKTPCANAAGTNCARRKTVRNRKHNAEVAAVGPANEDRQATGAVKRVRHAKRGHQVTTNARAEVRGTGESDPDTAPRRDRPGRYFLHGPRF